jgi:hypothetical protein
LEEVGKDNVIRIFVRFLNSVFRRIALPGYYRNVPFVFRCDEIGAGFPYVHGPEVLFAFFVEKKDGGFQAPSSVPLLGNVELVGNQQFLWNRGEHYPTSPREPRTDETGVRMRMANYRENTSLCYRDYQKE